MSNSPLDAYQQVVGLSFLANRASGYTGAQADLQKQLQYDLSFYLQNVPPVDSITPPAQLVPTLSNWSLEWGPVALEHVNGKGEATGVLDNAMYVAKCDSVSFSGGPVMPTYVVAIAATNFASMYDWDTEDFSVSKVVAWNGFDPANFSAATPPANTADPYISWGTATGVSNLLTAMKAADGTSLQSYLSTLDIQEDTAIIFAGHSLAGALAPTVALYLSEKNVFNSRATVMVYPTAGATPGNIGPDNTGGFVGLFNSTFPVLPKNFHTPDKQQPYQRWNTVLWNDLDVVPHAWGIDRLQEIATLFNTPEKKTGLPFSATLALLQDYVVRKSKNSGVTYAPLQNFALSGSLQESMYTNSSFTESEAVNVPPAGWDAFLSQLLIQHVDMYQGIPASSGLTPAVQGVTGLILTEPLPRPVPAPNPLTVPGVQQLTKKVILQKIEAWILHHLRLASLEGIDVPNFSEAAVVS